MSDQSEHVMDWCVLMLQGISDFVPPETGKKTVHHAKLESGHNPPMKGKTLPRGITKRKSPNPTWTNNTFGYK